MYKLVKPILMTNDIYNTISALKNKMMITSESNLLMIKDFKIEKIKTDHWKTHLFRPSEMVTEENEFLTEIEVMGYNNKLEYWGTYNGDDTIHTLFTYFDFQRMRDNYVRKIRRPLEKLGIEFTIKDETMKK